MRVVNTDNFNGDYPNESFLTPAGMDEQDAQTIAEIMNRNFSGVNASRIWHVVDNDYKLQPGFEP